MKHVIVVEDDPINGTLFRRLLERRGGWRVTVTDSPEELFALIRDGADVVLMDVSLGESSYEGRPVSGVDLSRLLKSDPRTARIPVILATAHAMRGDEQKLLAESHADDYLSKPIVDHDAFIQKVRGWLGEKAA